ncbi:MAG: AMP-binding protein, partial [Cyanobacteria bacterium J06635_15]
MSSVFSHQLSLRTAQQSAPDALMMAQIAAALLEQDTVIDCVVRCLSTAATPGQETSQFVVYIVLSVAFNQTQWQSRLQDMFGVTQAANITLVPITSIPLTADGDVDEAVLSKLPMLDTELAQSWSRQLTLQPEIRQAATTIEERQFSLGHLHLTDLLPVKQRQLTLETSVEVPTASQSKLVMAEPSQALAISCGEPLQSADALPTNLAQALRRTAQRFPTQGITYIQTDGTDVVQPYAELLAEAERILAGLQQLQLEPQAKLIFQFDNNQDYIPAFWACMLGGFVPVPIAIAPVYEPDNAVVQKLCNAWEHLEKPIVLTNESVARGLRSLVDQLALEDFTLQTIEALQPGEAILQDDAGYTTQPNDLAVLLLTSGSTGAPKGVMLTHHNILSNVAASAQVNQFTDQDISLNWLRLDHVGSLVRCCIRDVYVGSQQIHAPAERVLENPLKLLDWIERYRVTFAWAPNFALGLINNRAQEIQQRQWDLTSLRSMLSVAEAIVPKTAQRFAELLAPHGFIPEMMHSAWGMSETCAAVTFSHRYLLNLASPDTTSVEVGAPTAGFQMRIVDSQDQVLSEKTVGRLQIKGPMVLSGYYQNPALNHSAWTEDGWFKTGDLGYFRQGRLTVTGREKDVIIINGLNHYSHEIEAIVETVDGVAVSYTAAVGIRQPKQDTDLLLIFFSPSESQSDLAALLRTVRRQIIRSIGISPTHLIPVDKSVIPKTSIGKLQRLQLKQQFESGEFDQQVKQIDLLLENENTIPHWFYEKVWHPKAAVVLAPQPFTDTTLIFLDTLGLGETLKETLISSSQACVTVTPGTEFAQLSDHDYQLEAGNPDHYRQLLEALADRAIITQIIHLWHYSEATTLDTIDALMAAQDAGLYSLLGLVKALAAVRTSTDPTVRLQVVASQGQVTTVGESVAYEKSPVRGMIKAFSKEMAWLDCRYLDLPIATIEENVTHVLRELKVLQLEREVAIRQGRRLVPVLKQVDFSEVQPRGIPFKDRGIYLLSDILDSNLGGIGVEIAKYLLQQYQARLILVEHSPLPARSTWPTYLDQSSEMAARIRALMSLEALGVVCYEVVDIRDLARLSVLIGQVEHHWQHDLDGVIHLAGGGTERALWQETKASLSDMLRLKMIGAWVLHQLTKEKSDCLFIHLGSVMDFWGEVTEGSYAVANSFLESFSHYQCIETSLQSYYFGSSPWSQVGLEQGYQGDDTGLAQGQIAMSGVQGIQSLLTGLNYARQPLLFGLDGRHRNVQQYTIAASQPTQQLRAYVTLEDWGSLAELQRLTVVDRIGTPSECELIEVSLTSGEVDFEKLNHLFGPAKPTTVAPRNPIECQLAEIWQTILE